MLTVFASVEDPVSWTDEWTVWIAVLALVQPWLLWGYRRFLLRPSVTAYETSSVEIGYSNYGPTIGLHGTLKGQHRDVFVSNMNLELVRLKDRATHAFDWSMFRSHSIHINSPDQMSLEIAAGFMLTPEQPYRYNVLLMDFKTQYAIQNLLAPVLSAWNDLWPELRRRSALDLGKSQEDHRLAMYSEFSKGRVHLAAWENVRRACYWEAGEYELNLNVECSEPNKCFSQTWKFGLTEADVDRLRWNALEILSSACGCGNGVFQFVYAAYLDID